MEAHFVCGALINSIFLSVAQSFGECPTNCYAKVQNPSNIFLYHDDEGTCEVCTIHTHQRNKNRTGVYVNADLGKLIKDSTIIVYVF